MRCRRNRVAAWCALAFVVESSIAASMQEPHLAGGCDPHWIPTFGAATDLDDQVLAKAVFDDGSGPALYVGGAFSLAGGAPAESIARWDGESWSGVGGGVDGDVRSLLVHDDGSGNGPELYAGGFFTHAGGAPALHIAKWNGTRWAPLGSGTNDFIRCMKLHDDGSSGGLALYVGGKFTMAGGAPASRIARWDGTAWSPLGPGLLGTVFALETFDEGSGAGPELFAAGAFVNPANHVAKWNGTSWTWLGMGVAGDVNALATFDDGLGGGPALYAGGQFMTAGGAPASSLATWDGSQWSEVGGGLNSLVDTLEVLKDPSDASPALFVGGEFHTAGGIPILHIARWDGSTWSPLGSGMNSTVRTIASFDDGTGVPALYAGGYFQLAGGFSARYLARWDGSAWSHGQGLTGAVYALARDERGGSGVLVAGGGFSVAGAESSHGVARWDGSAWSGLGGGVDGVVLALAFFDEGSGPALFAAGKFTGAGGVAVNHVARWDGTSWSPLGSGLDGGYTPVHALAVYDDGLGGGPALYAAGEFLLAGGAPANRIAKWDGSAWSPVESGFDDTVYTLAVHEVAGRPVLFAGGEFTRAGGVPAYCIARWDGHVWRDLAIGTGNAVRCLQVYDDGLGGGPALYAGGSFLQAGHVACHHVARWDGQAFTPLGLGTNLDVLALTVLDDGAGPALYVGGEFTLAGGASATRVAKWDGLQWSALGGGPSGEPSALLGCDDGTGPALFVGGNFSATPAGDRYLAKWGCASSVGKAYCSCDGSGAPPPCGNGGDSGAGCANSTGSGARLLALGSRSVAADDLALSASHLPIAQPALLFVGLERVNGGSGTPFGDGLRCAGGGVRRLGVSIADASGGAAWGPGLGDAGSFRAGTVRRFQVRYRDPIAGPCGTGFNLTNAREVSFVR